MHAEAPYRTCVSTLAANNIVQTQYRAFRHGRGFEPGQPLRPTLARTPIYKLALIRLTARHPVVHAQERDELLERLEERDAELAAVTSERDQLHMELEVQGPDMDHIVEVSMTSCHNCHQQGLAVVRDTINTGDGAGARPNPKRISLAQARSNRAGSLPDPNTPPPDISPPHHHAHRPRRHRRHRRHRHCRRQTAEAVAKQRDKLHAELKIERQHVRGAVTKLDRALKREREMLIMLKQGTDSAMQMFD